MGPRVLAQPLPTTSVCEDWDGIGGDEKPAARHAMNCQKCGRELLASEKFCIACGTPAAPAAQPAPAAPEPDPPPPTEVRCDSCGEELTTDDRFCQSCGAQVGGPAITEGPARPLTESVEVEIDEVASPGVQPVGSRAALAPPPAQRSNATLYALLGLAFILIASSYFAYDYFSTLDSPNLASVPGEEIDLTQDGTALDPSGDANLQGQANVEDRALSQTTAPATPRLNTSPPSSAPRSAAPSPRRTSSATTQQTSPDTAPQEAAGRLDTPPTPPGIASSSSTTPPASQNTTQQTSPGTSQHEAAGRLNLPPTPPASASPKTPGGEVLMPGGKASKRVNTAPVKPPPAAPPAPPPLKKGTIYWTGKLQKNQVIVIEKGEATVGIADGDHFTGIPIDVHLPSPAVSLVERPTAQNNWSRVAFRCLRTTKQSVTINIQWNLLR